MAVTVLYKLGSKDKIQVWKMHVTGDRYRTSEGFQGGAVTESEWTIATPKNVGKKNEVSAEEQAFKEALAKVKKKLEKGYVRDIKEVANVDRFQVMLAHKYEDHGHKIGFPCVVQPKLDGMRCYINKDGMWSRENKPVISAPHIFEAVKHIFDKHPNLVLDGELYNHSLKHDFNKLISLVRRTKPTPEELKESKELVEYHLYDVCGLNKPYIERMAYFWLDVGSSILLPVQTVIRTVVFKFVKNQAEMDKEYEEFLTKGYEGQMVRANTPYENKRSYNLLKRKEWITEEFEITDILEGIGNRSGMMGKIVMKNHHNPGKTFDSDGAELGGHEFYREMLANKKNYIGKLATVRYQNLTPGEKAPRFGKVIAIRDYE